MDQTTPETLQEALALIKAGQEAEASVLLSRILRRDPQNEQAWHMLSYAQADPSRQIYALRRVLKINPENSRARARLNELVRATAEPTPSIAAAPGSTSSGQPARQEEQESPKQLPSTKQAQPRQPAAEAARIATAPGGRRAAVGGGAAVAVAAPRAKIPIFPARQLRHESEFSRGQWLKLRARLFVRRFRENWAVFSQSRLAVFGVILIGLFALMAVAHPILMRTVWPRSIYDPVTGFDLATAPHPSPPGPGHLLGTDTLGRDVLSMLLAATTPTFIVGFTAALTTAIVGTLLSMTAAYFRGTVDSLITNLADVFLLFPAPVIMVIIGARFRDLGPVPLGLIYGLVTGAGGATLVLRAHGLHVVSKPFMEAAHIAGGGAWHIISRHLLPAMMPLAALQMMIAVSGAVVADGFISFFGLTRTTSNWGTIIYDAFVYGQVRTGSSGMWHMLLPAAACFSLFALGFYLVSRGLHRVASPTIREELPGR